jgi:hypothetical protein
MAVIFGCGPVLYQNEVCLAASGPLVSTNTACLSFWLQFQTTADTLNQCYIVSRYSYRWIWPGVPYQMIYGRIPQFTVSGAVIL